MSEQLELAVRDESGALPTSWKVIPVGMAATLQVGFAFKSARFRESGIRLLRGDNIEPGALRWKGAKCWPENESDEFEHLRVEVGDVILAMDRPVVSSGLKLAMVRANDLPALLVQRVARLRSVVGPNAYLRYALERPAFLDHIRDGQTGTMLPHISGGTINSFSVPVPPLPEQRRIVAEIEKQFTRLDAAVANLERVKANLKRARASVLKAAVEGRLVPTEAELARAEGRDYEPASVLLERILAERKRKHEESDSKKKYKPPVEPETDGLPKLPEGWTWASVDQAAKEGLINGRSVPTRDGGFPVLRLTAMRRGRIDFSEAKGGDWSEEDARNWLVEAGDFFIMRGNGSVSRVGSAAIAATVPYPVAYPDTMIRLRPIRALLRSDYLLAVWSSPFFRRQIEESARTTAGIYKVNQGSIASYCVPVPPQQEQTRIVAEVERRLSVLTALEATVATNLARCDRLRQSILKRAFEGKLVPQDPTDEPASALLARIQAQAEAATPPKRAKKKASKKKASKKKASKKKASKKKTASSRRKKTSA